jgi:hypothetical protein
MNPTHASHGWSLGPALIVVGLTAVVWSGDIPRTGLGDTHDPGARAFPMGVGVCLVLGGIYQLVLWARGRGSGGNFSMHNMSKALATCLDAKNRDAWILVGALLLYVPAILWLGFSLSTLLFSLGLMVRLGAGWKLAVMMSLVIVVVINLLFAGLFKVQFPGGSIGLPF